MVTRWHPLLAQFLRQDYGDRLIIEEEVPLGEMPLRADLLLIRRDPQVQLPYPFNWLGVTTLVEFKGPEEATAQEDLVKLEVYGLLYQLREGMRERKDLTLWLVASQFTTDVSQSGGAQLCPLQEVGPGVTAGNLDGFPTCLVNLQRLPVTGEALPLLMVTKGAREREVMEFLLAHRGEYPAYLAHALLWHQQALEEVLRMKELTVDELGIEVDVGGVIRLLGRERVLRELARSPEVDVGGVIRMLGEERVLQELARSPEVD
ncbi:MAG TPA: hypothetical protein EYP85_16525, partial [Armatimonadetes bacterium]|nr:hypothetical protein [Armatimonadota bacterium]